MLIIALAMGLGSGLAVAEESSAEMRDSVPLMSEESGARLEPETNVTAAEDLPKEDLNRDQAEELLQEVFGEELEVPADFFDELEVEDFRTDHVALVESQEAGAPAGLLSSTLPLRAENESGEKEIVDLDLEQIGRYLQPENPLVEVHIPSELANGISLPSAGVTIKLAAEGDERNGTEIGEASAFYPNVRPETDVAITAVPTGVESYAQIRSPEAPRQESYELSIPSGPPCRPPTRVVRR